jgi:hypothetical protein
VSSFIFFCPSWQFPVLCQNNIPEYGNRSMARPNYSFEKRQRELAKKKKKEEKREQKAAARSSKRLDEPQAPGTDNDPSA